MNHKVICVEEKLVSPFVSPGGVKVSELLITRDHQKNYSTDLRRAVLRTSDDTSELLQKRGLALGSYQLGFGGAELSLYTNGTW